jgi:hypothetical protein
MVLGSIHPLTEMSTRNLKKETWGVKGVVIVDKLHWIFVVRADKIKPLFTPKV